MFVHDFDSSGIGIHFFETKCYTDSTISSSEESQSSHVLKGSTNEASNKAYLVLNALVGDGCCCRSMKPASFNYLVHHF